MVVQQDVVQQDYPHLSVETARIRNIFRDLRVFINGECQPRIGNSLSPVFEETRSTAPHFCKNWGNSSRVGDVAFLNGGTAECQI